MEVKNNFSVAHQSEHTFLGIDPSEVVDKQSNPFIQQNWSINDDKNKDILKNNTVKTNLTSLTTVLKECLRTTEPKVNNHSESSVETPSQRKMSIELLQFHGGKRVYM